MSIEILLIIVLSTITVLAYMIAINSHGPTRLSISYFMATIILAVTVWVTVQYVNSGQMAKTREELSRLEAEKKKAEEEIKAKEQEYQSAIKNSKEKFAIAARLNSVITTGTNLATQIVNANLRDQYYELETLIARAAEVKRKAEELSVEFEKIEIQDNVFTPTISQIKDAIKTLIEAAQYYVLFYKAEDSAQEDLRERIMRQKARQANEGFQRASSFIANLNIR
jgi:hypothetical protein